MQVAFQPALRGIALLVPMLLSAAGPQATIHDSGSTNVPGLRVAVDQDGHATVEQPNGDSRQIKLPEDLCRRFMRHVKEAGPLNMLPARHCMKSASFGSRIVVEFNGGTSPDLTCPGPADPRLEALQKDASEMLQAAREAAGIQPRNKITVPAPNRPKS